jgi:hypothetical protein
MTPRADRLAAAVLLSGLAIAPAARADQALLIDESYTHTQTSHHMVKPLASAPRDWRMPVNYYQGTAYVRVEVKSKPSTAAVNYEICFISRSGYGCLGAHKFTQPTVLNYAVSLPSMWQYADVDWSMPLTSVALIVKNGSFAKVDTPDPQYYPMQLRVTITIVSKGAMLMPMADGGAAPPAPPPSPDAGVAVDAGRRADTGGAPIAPDPGSAPIRADAGSGGTGGAPTMPQTATTTSTPAPTRDPGADDTPTPTPKHETAAGGCAVGGAGGGGAMTWVLALWLFRRRRRR